MIKINSVIKYIIATKIDVRGEFCDRKAPNVVRKIKLTLEN